MFDEAASFLRNFDFFDFFDVLGVFGCFFFGDPEIRGFFDFAGPRVPGGPHGRAPY